MKKIILLIIVLCIAVYSNTQVERLVKKSENLFTKNPIASLDTAKIALSIAKKIKNDSLISIAMLRLAEINSYFSFYDNAQKYYDSVIYHYSSDKIILSKSFYNLGILYLNKNEFEKSREYFYKANEIYYEFQDYIKLSNGLNQIAISFLEEVKNNENIELNNELEKASFYADSSKKLILKNNYNRNLINSKILNGKIEVLKGDFKSAIRIFNATNELLNDLSNENDSLYSDLEFKNIEIEILRNIANSHKNRGNLREAVNNYLKAKNIIEKYLNINEDIILSNQNYVYDNINYQMINHLIDILNDLIKVYGDKINDDISLEVKFQKINQYSNYLINLQQILYKNQIIQNILTKENTNIKEENIEIENENLELDEKNVDLKEDKQIIEKWLFFLILATILLVFVVILIYRGFQHKRKSNKILSEKNDKIENLNKELKINNIKITDSIKYAKKIQDAVLLEKEEIDSIFPENFILYEPKDLVSGDFYWFDKINEERIAILADCTGHGVPGSYMSLIGHTFLTEIIHDKGITSPKKILELLDINIRKALKQDKENSKSNDGMDIVVISHNVSNDKLLFAGAKRPLYLVKDNNLREIKGTRRSIGGRKNSKLKEKDYEEQVIENYKDYTIYLTTDGYSDQNSPDGKKFGLKRLKETLVEINKHKNLKTQKDDLAYILQMFRQNEELRDDVSIIGLKLNE